MISKDYDEKNTRKTAAHGHFGRDEPEFTWEKSDKVAALRASVRL